MVVDCAFEAGRSRSARLIPLALNEIGLGGPDDMATRGGPTFVAPAQGAKILERVAARSRPFGGRIGVAASGEGALSAPASAKPQVWVGQRMRAMRRHGSVRMQIMAAWRGLSFRLTSDGHPLDPNLAPYGEGCLGGLRVTPSFSRRKMVGAVGFEPTTR